jgi:starch-binding outer membrane protein, SusD/RagB family
MTMRRILPILAQAATLATLAACADTTVPDLNNGSVSGFQSSPTAAGASAIAIGLLRGARDNTALIVSTIGPFGREGYELNLARGDLPDYIIGPLTPGTFYVAQLWIGEYADLRSAYLLLDNVNSITDLSTTQKEGLTGFAQTMQAYDLDLLAETRDTLGLPIDVNVDPTGKVVPIATKAQVYQHMLNLLDSAATHLGAAGPTFSFPLPPGFANFSTPATFLTFNRALRARVDIQINQWNDAITDLNASFMSTSLPLTYGPAFDYSANSGDEPNPLFTPFNYVEPALVTNAQHQPGGAPDQRVINKIGPALQPVTLDSISSNLRFLQYLSTSSPLPVIRNEELILLHAEANLGLGQLSSVVTDLNFIRQQSGGLAPLSAAAASSPDSLLEDLLYEKRYSLLWEGGHNWLDMRHYGKLAEIPKDLASSHIFTVVPFPIEECQARSPKPAGCTNDPGI